MGRENRYFRNGNFSGSTAIGMVELIEKYKYKINTVYLLWNEDLEDYVNADSIKIYKRVVEERYPGITVELDHRPLKDPTVHQELFSIQKSILTKLLKESDDEIFINISSGTGAMHATWLIATGLDLKRIKTVQSFKTNTRIEETFFPLIDSVFPNVSQGIQTAYKSEASQPSSLAFSDDSEVVDLEKNLEELLPETTLMFFFLENQDPERAVC